MSNLVGKLTGTLKKEVEKIIRNGRIYAINRFIVLSSDTQLQCTVLSLSFTKIYSSE